MSPPIRRVHPYVGRAAALATKHGKERLLARPLRAALGLELRAPSGKEKSA